jgi:thymidylate kinase
MTAAFTVSDQLKTTPGTKQSQADFLVSLFRELEASKVRYGVLHSWEGLPDGELSGDLDLAIHPQDAAKLTSVLAALRDRGYRLVQCVNYAVNASCFVFLWAEASKWKSVAVDVAFEYRALGRLIRSGEQLVTGRQKRGLFWVAGPAVEFAYLLSKKLEKRTISDDHERKLKLLVREIGAPQAEQIACELVGGRCAQRVVQACTDRRFSRLVRRAAAQAWKVSLLRHPAGTLKHFVQNSYRLLCRCLQPTGMLVVVLGPDGAGKSTLVDHITNVLALAFQRHRRFHWRPMMLRCKRATVTCTTDPHSVRLRGFFTSIIYLSAFFLDHLLGYVFIIRPLLVRSGLVTFDRYFDDVLVDPKRYRYGGPQWLPGLYSGLLPRPDMVLLVEAPEEVILSRKREVGIAELRRQRIAYRHMLGELQNVELVETGMRSQATTLAEISERAVERLSQKCQRLHATANILEPTPRSVEFKDLESALRQLIAPASVQAEAVNQHSLESERSHAIVLSPTNCIRQELRQNGFGKHQDFLAVPSARAPKWALPLGDPNLTTAVLQMYVPFASSAILKKKLLAVLLKAGWQGWSSSHVLLATKSELPLGAFVRDVTGENSPRFSLWIGTPERFRAVTIQVMRPGGEILGYIKVSLTYSAIERIQHEAQLLNWLWGFPQLRSHIPKVLHAGKWGEGYLLFQSPGPSRAGSVVFGEVQTAFLQKLWSVQPVKVPGHLLVERIGTGWRTAQPLLHTTWRELGQDALRRAYQGLDGASIPCGVMHGDFAPWNTREQNRQLFVFDWQSAALEMPTSWDIFHFCEQVTSLLHTKQNSELSKVNRNQKALFFLYALHSVCQTVEAGGPRMMPKIEFKRRQILQLLRTDSGLPI